LLRQLAWDIEHAKPLPLIEPMPQLRGHGLNGTPLRTAVYRLSWLGAVTLRAIGESAG
jgi:hypothetical protein